MPSNAGHGSFLVFGFCFFNGIIDTLIVVVVIDMRICWHFHIVLFWVRRNFVSLHWTVYCPNKRISSKLFYRNHIRNIANSRPDLWWIFPNWLVAMHKCHRFYRMKWTPELRMLLQQQKNLKKTPKINIFTFQHREMNVLPVIFVAIGIRLTIRIQSIYRFIEIITETIVCFDAFSHGIRIATSHSLRGTFYFLFSSVMTLIVMSSDEKRT